MTDKQKLALEFYCGMLAIAAVVVLTWIVPMLRATP